MKTPPVKSLRIRATLALSAALFTAHYGLANTELWIGVSGTSVTTNWSDNANWNNVTGGGTPGPNGNAVVFGDGGSAPAATVNSVVDNGALTPTSLTFTNNSGAGSFHTVLIPTVLTNTGTLVVGIQNSLANSYTTTVGMVGPGTLVQLGTPLTVDNSTTVGGSGLLPTLDLSGLTNFVYTNGGGALNIAGFNGAEARGSGQLNLAAGSNYITVGTITIATATGNGGIGGTLNLGAGTNIINVGTMNLAAGKINNATMKFFDPTTGGLRIRGVTGADSDRNVTITLGNRSNSGSGTPTGTLTFTGHPVDVKANTVTMGRSNQAGNGTGVLAFDMGIFDALVINMATNSSTGVATGTITVGTSGTLIVSNLSLAAQTAGTANGTLTINGGTVICSNRIVKATTAGTGTIAMTGGSLNVATNIGTVTSAIDTFSVSDSTLTLPAGLTASAYATNLTASGTANTINVSSVPTFFSYPAQFPVISYATAGGDNNTFVVGTIPGGFQGFISNNTVNLSIDLVITNGPAFAPVKSVTWNGLPNGNWTNDLTTATWITNNVAANFNQGDLVTFDDTLKGTTNVIVTTALLPGSVTVNNSLSNYVFTGIGKIGGATGLAKTGTGTLVVDNSGTNDFVGPVSVGAGGILQLGNNDANGNLPAVPWDIEGTLVFNHANNVLVFTNVSGGGSLVQSGTGKLTLTGPNAYTGNTTVSNGTFALTGAGAISTSAQTLVRNGGTFDVSAAATPVNLTAVGLAGGTFVVSTNTAAISALSSTNSTITLVANANAASVTLSSLVTSGTTNYINITGVLNVSETPSLPVVIPLMTYGSATFNGGFNIGETNFPNAYISNDVANSSIDLVLTAVPYFVTWNGGSGTGNNWSDSNNWSGVSIFAGDNLIFDGSTRVNPVNDIAAGTLYSNITFNAGASSFALSGNPIAVNGIVANNSPNAQTILLGVNFNSSVAFNATSGPMIIGGGLTNTLAGAGYTTNTFSGTGILTNILASSTSPGGTNVILLNDSAANWTLMDNASSATNTVPWSLEVNNGTFNFGSATSAPKLVSTTPNGAPQDNQLGSIASAVSVLNFSNGTFTTTARLNTGTASAATGTINQYGGTMNIGSQFQGANAAGGISAVNLVGGTMNIGTAAIPTSPFYIASRGTGTLNISNAAVLNCGVLDVSRSIVTSTLGTVNLDGGTLTVQSVGTATANAVATTTGSTATFNFNGGTLKARTNSATFFRGSIVNPIVPITTAVQAGGAIIDTDTNTVTFLEPLLTDPALAGATDGGLTKRGTGTLTFTGVNTYNGVTTVGAGTLAFTGSSTVSTNNTVIAGGAVLDVSGLASPLAFVSGQTLSNSSSTAAISGNADASLATVSLTYASGTPSLLSTNGTLTLASSTPFTVKNTGAALAAGSYKIIAKATGGTVAGTAPSSVVVSGGGLAGGATASLQITGGELFLVVVGGTPPPTPRITHINVSGITLSITATNGALGGQFVLLGSTNVALPVIQWTRLLTNNFDGSGNLNLSTNIVNPAVKQQFYLLAQ